MKTIVYIDGYNLYYGALKAHPEFKWLDVHSMCSALLPSHEVIGVKYFTARVKAYPNDPSQPQRQHAYLRAQGTSKLVKVIEGWYIIDKKSAVLAADYAKLKPGDMPPKVTIIKSEEKGSDVNLAVHLLLDGTRKLYEMPTVLSCDSDLKEPLRMVRKELGYNLALITPQASHNNKLAKFASTGERYWVKDVNLALHQFPNELQDAEGRIIHRPSEWTISTVSADSTSGEGQ